MTIRVFVCDDHPILRDGLRHVVQSQPDLEFVGEAENGVSAVEQVKALVPNVVVMDMSLPQLNGALATKQIRAACPETHVVAFTVHDEPTYLQTFLTAGATGYVLKNGPGDLLSTAIRKVAAGERFIDPAMTAALETTLAKRAPVDNGGAALSEREEQVVQLLAQGYTNKEIAKDLAVSVKTIETYKSRALEKLNLHSRAELVRFAVKQGWLSNFTKPAE